MEYIALSIPIFFFLIGVELLIGLVRNRELYRFNDAVTNLSCGIGSQVLGLYFKVFIFMAYVFIYDHLRLFTFENSALTWIICFLGVDFFYYWFHRLSHEINFIWATHIVHHQSEEYNLSVALRQSWFQGLISWVFYIPLAVAGFSPIMIVTVAAFNTLYQFWIHTETIRRMGPLEWILNTPSHHRVHHGSNPKYIDKNHAGTLIIWDKMFGTFQAEEEEPVYGITKPINSWNPVWANFHYWDELWQTAKKTPRLVDKIKVFTMPPGWFPEHLGGFQAPPEVDKSSFHKFNIRISKELNFYLLLQFTLVLGLTSYYMFTADRMFEQADRSLLFTYSFLAVYIILAMWSIGLAFEKRSSFFPAELARLMLTFLVVYLFAGGEVPLWVSQLMAAVTFISLLWLLFRNQKFMR